MVEAMHLAVAAPMQVTLSAPVAGIGAMSASNAFYSKKHGAVMARWAATYGPHAWPLPPVLKEHPDEQVRMRVFAAALLGGRVDIALEGTCTCVLWLSYVIALCAGSVS